MEWGFVLSEEANVTFLQEKIREAKRNERVGDVLFIFGLVLAFASWIIPITLYYNYLPSMGVPMLFGIIGGTSSIVIGLTSMLYYSVKHTKLTEHLRMLAS